MRIRVVDPNTTASMIAASARTVAGPGTVVDAVTSAAGPASIESRSDEAPAEIAAGSGPVWTVTCRRASASPVPMRPANRRPAR